MARANDRQVGGAHYKQPEGVVEHWDIVHQHHLDYFQGQITKYVMRWRSKGGINDLEKARHFLDKYIELAEKEGYGAKEAVATQSILDCAAQATTTGAGLNPNKYPRQDR